MVPQTVAQVPIQSFPIQDEPEGGACFQHKYLRPGLTVATLERIAGLMSDTEAARRMQQAKHKLFEQLRKTA